MLASRSLRARRMVRGRGAVRPAVAATAATRCPVRLAPVRPLFLGAQVGRQRVVGRRQRELARPRASLTQRRLLNLHEHHSQTLLAEHGVAVAPGFVATTPEEALAAAKKIGSDVVIKAQVLAGGRGKGRFTNGFQGGVHACSAPEEAAAMAARMLGQRLVTAQTGEAGKPCNSVLVAERLFLRREAYFALTMDREMGGVVMVGSPAGGMDIEAVAEATPDQLSKVAVGDLDAGPTEAQLSELAHFMGFRGASTQRQATKVCSRLYDFFTRRDCTLLEVNPLVETHDGRVLCVDAKLNFDDNAEFRQRDLFQLYDPSQEDPREVQASKAGLNYIGLDGDIGCLVNGAGLAMATMDEVQLHGGAPANFLDLGGGATEQQVCSAFSLLNYDSSVRAVLVNIFGGIARCDTIALGIIRAATETGLRKPLIVRLAGTNVKEAERLIEESGLRIHTAPDLQEAAQKAVRVVQILKMAEEAKVTVAFELPI